MSRSRRLNRPVIAGIVLAACMGVTATLAASPSTAEPGPAPEIITNPDPAEVAIDEVRAAGDAVSLYKEPGFGKVTLDLDAREVRVFWKGTPPTEVSSRVGVDDNGVTTTLVPTEYSDAELLEAAEDLMYAGLEAEGTPISFVSQFPDLSGLTAAIRPRILAKSEARDATASDTGLEEKLEDIAGVPVETKTGLPPTTGLTRQNDSPPWQGGGAMIFGNGFFCSTGFAVLTSTGAGRLLSAAHCDLSANRVINDGTDNQVISNGGDAVDRADAFDSLLIDPAASPGTIGKIFGGPFNAGTGADRYEFFVGGFSIPQEGDAVCFSGANSGEHCANKTIQETSGTFFCPQTTVVCQGFRSGGGGTVTGVGGDSGGPVYSNRAGTQRKWARGIISAEVPGTEVACPNTRTGTSRCYSQVWSIGIHSLLDRWNARLEVE